MLLMVIMVMIVIKLIKCYVSCYFSHSAGGGSWDSSGDEDNNMFGSNSKVRKSQKVVISPQKFLSSQFAWLAQLGERRSAEREVAGSNPARTNTQGLKITEKKVLPL